MREDSRYLKKFGRLLASRGLLKKQYARPISRSGFGWLKITSLIALGVLALSAPFFITRSYKAVSSELSDSTEVDHLEIEKLIRQVQSEISKSEQERKEKNIAPMFQLKSFELEISFVVKRTLIAGGAARYEVITVDSQLQTGAERTHRLKLTMDVAATEEGAVGPSEIQPLPKGQALESSPPGKGRSQ